MVNADRLNNAASYMEMTVPLLHEPLPAIGSLTKGSGAHSGRMQQRPAQAGQLQYTSAPPPGPQHTGAQNDQAHESHDWQEFTFHCAQQSVLEEQQDCC